VNAEIHAAIRSTSICVGRPPAAARLLALICTLSAACGTAAPPLAPADSGPVSRTATGGEPRSSSRSQEAAASIVPSSSAAPARVYGNRVTWKTASELNNFGYDIYRGESPEGPFRRITPRVIEGAGTTDEPSAYEYWDRTINPHKTYYYYVESISMNGVRERFTPIARAGPKIAPEGDGDAEVASPAPVGSAPPDSF